MHLEQGVLAFTIKLKTWPWPAFFGKKKDFFDSLFWSLDNEDAFFTINHLKRLILQPKGKVYGFFP